MRVVIRDERTHKVATYWVSACIGIHAFAMRCEDEERAEDEGVSDDSFIDAGLSSDADSSDDERPERPRAGRAGGLLAEGKQRRNELKAALLAAKQKRAEKRAQRRHRRRMQDVDSDA
jgi:hypothetical protein